VARDIDVLRERWRLLDDEIVFACPARFVRQKDHSTLFAAFARLVRQTPDRRVRLVLLGRGRLEATLRREVAAAGLFDRVVFGGFLPDLGPVYSMARAVVLPSIHEGLGLVLVEAALHGVPAVATRVGGIPEVVQDGVTGRLVAPSDPSALCAALADFVDDGNLAQRCGAAARDHAARVFDVDARTADLFALYDRVLGVPR
jgi:glycosyltransferase involved in cell wall biosynthesis